MKPTPNVFIMSSSSGLSVARALGDILSREKRIDVRIWDSHFRAGEAFIDRLQSTMIQYDFGLSVLTPDDLTTVRAQKAKEPRDNVILELGLCIGSRGRRRALPIVVKVGKEKPSLPTDVRGMINHTIEVDQLDHDNATMVSIIERDGEAIAKRILELYDTPEPTILPSTGLAMGYFENFIHSVMSGLHFFRQVNLIDGKSKIPSAVALDRVMLTICIPDNIEKATKEDWGIMAQRLDLVMGDVDSPPHGPRSYPFRMSGKLADGALHIYDAPTTLRAVRFVVAQLLPSPTYNAADRAMAEEREIQNFTSQIQYLCSQEQFRWFSRRLSIKRWSELP